MQLVSSRLTLTSKISACACMEQHALSAKEPVWSYGYVPYACQKERLPAMLMASSM